MNLLSRQRTLEQIATAHMLHASAETVGGLGRRFPQAMDQVITTGMAKEPDQRYASTKDLATAARAAVGADQDRTQAASAGPYAGGAAAWTAQPTGQLNQPGPDLGCGLRAADQTATERPQPDPTQAAFTAATQYRTPPATQYRPPADPLPPDAARRFHRGRAETSCWPRPPHFSS